MTIPSNHPAHAGPRSKKRSQDSYPTVASVYAPLAPFQPMQHGADGARPIVILRRPQVEHRTGLRHTSLYARLQKGGKQYDPTFPKQVPLTAPSPHRKRSPVGWIESEIDAWLAQRCSERVHD